MLGGTACSQAVYALGTTQVASNLCHSSNNVLQSTRFWRKLFNMPKRNLIWILAIIVAAAVIMWVAQRNPPPARQVEPDEFSYVSRTYRLIQDRYYRPIKGERLRQGAVNGMVSQLDEFSSYVSPARLEAFTSRMMGIDRGVGLRLIQTDGRIRVVGPLINSPAHKAGIVGGDFILAIDGVSLEGALLSEAERMLRGPLGAKVELAIERSDGSRRNFSVIRGKFPIQSVRGLYRDRNGQWVYLIAPGENLGYVRITEFVRDTGLRVGEILRSLGSLRGLILDLRDNPGGMLPAIEEVCNLFLRQGTIGTSITRNRTIVRFTARADGTLPEIPMVVLINSKTVSAAEIVAGALRLHGRAVLVGTRTRGKGCVQSMFPLPGELGQVNLTTAELLVGDSGTIIRQGGSDQWGVDPHPEQEVTLSLEVQERLRVLHMEAEMLRAQQDDQPATRSAGATEPINLIKQRLVNLDAQLARALKLLSKPDEISEILARREVRHEGQGKLTTTPAEGTQ